MFNADVWAGPAHAGAEERTEAIELVGPHLRLAGRIALRGFSRLSDLVNHTRGYVLLHDARLLRRNGQPTNVTVDELMVNQDEITFIAQQVPPPARCPSTPGALMDFDRPALEKEVRRYVFLTEGHAISGLVHVYREMTLATFVDTSDPRFIPVTEALVRSLADRRVVSRFDLMLINRTHMTAAAEASKAASVTE